MTTSPNNKIATSKRRIKLMKTARMVNIIRTLKRMCPMKENITKVAIKNIGTLRGKRLRIGQRNFP